MANILLSACGFDQGKSGIAVYIREIVRQLLLSGHHITMMISRDDFSYWRISHQHLRIKVLPKFLNSALVNTVWHCWLMPFQIRPEQFDLAILPAGNRRIWCHYPLPTVVTVHDLSQYVVDGKYDFFRTLYIKRVLPRYIKKAPRLIAVSQNTRNDMIRYLGIRGENVAVHHLGYDRKRFSAKRPSSMADVAKRLGVMQGCLLYVARIEHPGKNHVRLIDAYESLPESIREKHQLVFAGSLWSGSDVVLGRIACSKARHQIKVLGFVDDKDLPSLYHLAQLLVMPSLYEGFGIPLIEAMACALVVACSQTPALDEVAAGAAMQFRGDDSNAIAAALEKLLNNHSLCEHYRQLGLQRVQTFDWDAHTRRLLAMVNDYSQLTTNHIQEVSQ